MAQRAMTSSVDQPRLTCGPVRLGVGANGIVLWALRGSEGEGDGGQGGAGTGSGSEGGEGGSGGGSGSGEGSGEGGSSNNEGGTTVSKEEFDRLTERMKAADRRAQAAEDKIKEAERANLSEVEKQAADLQAATERVSALEQELKDLKVQNAFLSANDVQWHDSEAALKMADLSGVLSSDGSVDSKALKKALEDLSKSKPFLVKAQSAGGEGGNGNEGGSGGGNGSSGGNVGGGGKKNEGKGLTQEELVRKYPALRR